MAQISLYYQTQLETKVSLFPEQINANIDSHLLDNLKSKMEGKTDENGFIVKINKLIDYDYGMIDKTTFMATTIYRVKYECLLCSPVKDLEMICVVDNIIKGFLIAHNGPVIAAIQFNNVDTQKFEISGDNIIHIKTKKQIEKKDHLKVSIININNNLGEKEIVTLCKLMDLATERDIEQFNEEQALATNKIGNDDKEFI